VLAISSTCSAVRTASFNSACASDVSEWSSVLAFSLSLLFYVSAPLAWKTLTTTVELATGRPIPARSAVILDPGFDLSKYRDCLPLVAVWVVPPRCARSRSTSPIRFTSVPSRGRRERGCCAHQEGRHECARGRPWSPGELPHRGVCRGVGPAYCRASALQPAQPVGKHANCPVPQTDVRSGTSKPEEDIDRALRRSWRPSAGTCPARRALAEVPGPTGRGSRPATGKEPSRAARGPGFPDEGGAHPPYFRKQRGRRWGGGASRLPRRGRRGESSGLFPAARSAARPPEVPGTRRVEDSATPRAERRRRRGGPQRHSPVADSGAVWVTQREAGRGRPGGAVRSISSCCSTRRPSGHHARRYGQLDLTASPYGGLSGGAVGHR